MRLDTEQIVYRDGDGRLTGFLVIDAERAGKRPGVLVVHGGAGVDDHARGRARRFAEAGFVAFACDMYGEGVTGNRERIMRHIGQLRTSRGAIIRRVQAASEILLSRPEIDGRMAAVGYCFGGMIVLEYARSGSTISAVVMSTEVWKRPVPPSRHRFARAFWSATERSTRTCRCRR